MREVLVRIRHMATVIVVTAIVGCGGSPDTGDTAARSTSMTDDGVYTIGMSQSDRSDPWQTQMDTDIEAAVSKHDDLNIVLEDAGDDAERQQQQVEQFIDQGVDLIMICPTHAQQLTEPVAKAYDAGIPVIVLHRHVIGDKYTCFIGADHKQIGAAAARWLTDNVPGRVNVLELEDPERSAEAVERQDGLRSALIDPRFTILSGIPVSGKEDIARREMEAALEAFEKIDVVVGHDDAAAHDAYLAAKQAGREADITFLGIGSLPKEGIEYVRTGELNVTLQLPTGGVEAVDTAVQLLNGKEVPKRVTLKSRFFTKENAESGGQAID